MNSVRCCTIRAAGAVTQSGCIHTPATTNAAMGVAHRNIRTAPDTSTALVKGNGRSDAVRWSMLAASNVTSAPWALSTWR